MSRVAPIFAAFIAVCSALVGQASPVAAEGLFTTPAPSIRERNMAGRETAIFAGGCFWGVQGVFSHVRGVVSTTAGYDGGSAATAQYAIVSTGATGHAESVKVVFDPREVNYVDLLRIYFSVITDPTQLNRQGPDEGKQYRSVLFPQTPAQASVARAYIAQLSKMHVFRRPIVTRIEQGYGFFPAEDYHQQFMAKNPDYPYIAFNDRPKVAALQKLFPSLWKS